VLAMPVLIVMAWALPFSSMWYQAYSRQRELIAQLNALPPNDPSRILIVRSYGSIQAYAAAQAAPFRTREFALYVLKTSLHGLHARVTLLLLAWPWIAAISFVLFRDTLRQASIKSVHVIRCAIYSSDVGLMLALPLLLLMRWRSTMAVTLGQATSIF